MISSLFKGRKSSKEEQSLVHDDYFNELRLKEFSRLDDQKQVYLDFTGGNLYGQSQIESHFQYLNKRVLGNPHSSNPSSQLSTQMVEEARSKVIEFFNASDYYCIFTQNASGALKIIGECYPFEEDGRFLLLADNHNSVNGIREYCMNSGGSHEYIPVSVEDLMIPEDELRRKLKDSDGEHKLFAFPAQSNVSGVKHDLQWIREAQELGWHVLLDAAAFVPTSPLDLKKHQADFVSISFYKIFGYPTGIGCLLVKKSSFNILRKRWFAGGTVSLAAAAAPFHFLTNDHERFENGTINYLDIPALKIGLDFIDKIGINRINERVASMNYYLYEKLSELEHSNGIHQVELFGPKDRKDTGGTLIMCFKNPDKSKIDFEKIEELANQANISIRSGCFCNPGLDETNNCLTSTELAQYFSSRESGDYKDMIQFLNKMRGATRVSVGMATIKEDLDAFISLIAGLKDKSVV